MILEWIVVVSNLRLREWRIVPEIPRIIAEIGVNHEGSLDRAKLLIDLAAQGGAQVCKFQSYSADLIASKQASPAYWDLSEEPTESQYDLFAKFGTLEEKDYEALAAHCADNGVEFMSTPFDQQAAEFLNPLVREFKIASADLTNIPLIEKVMSFRKPIIISAGAASLEEVGEAAKLLSSHPETVTFMHCVLNYPTSRVDANLGCIGSLKDLLEPRFRVGYSDHVAPDTFGRMETLEAAFFMGATVLEKHFTDDKKAKGNDHYHAMDIDDLKKFVEWMERASEIVGTGIPDLEVQQAARANARRRVFYRSNLPKGHILTEADLIPLRANIGIEIAKWRQILGATLEADVREGMPAEWPHLNIS